VPLLALWVAQSLAQEPTIKGQTLLFSATFGVTEQGFQLAKVILGTIGAKAGMNLQLQSLPHGRTAGNLESGATDAVLGRAAYFQHNYPDSIMISESVSIVPYYIYTKLKDIEVKFNDLDSLKPYKIVSLRGNIVTSEYLKGYSTHAVNSVGAAIRFIDADRADLFLSSLFSVHSLLKSTEFKSSGIREIGPVLKLPVFTFFRPGLEREAQAYEVALIALKQNGTMSKLLREFR
jgi:hypothetical protein